MTITMDTHMGIQAKSSITAMIMEVATITTITMTITMTTIMTITMTIIIQDQKRWTPIFKSVLQKTKCDY